MVQAQQRRGDFDFSVKLCEVEPDPRYDGNHVFGLTWRVPGEETHEVKEVYVIGDSRQDRVQWYEEHEVDTTSPNRVFIKAVLPWDGRTPWIRLEWPRAWGYDLTLRATLTPEHLQIRTDNLQAFRLEPEGPLENPLAGMRLVVDDETLGPLPQGRQRVSRNQTGGWTIAPAEPLDWDELGFIGASTEHLSRGPQPGQGDSPPGQLVHRCCPGGHRC